MTWKFYGKPQKTIGHLRYTMSSFVHHFKAIGEFKLELKSGNAQLGVLCDLEIWRMTLKNNRAPLLCYFKLCASFHSHPWIQNGVTVQKCQIWVKISDFLSCVTLAFDLWHWPLAWISLLSLVITPENFMIRRWEHSEKGVTNGRTERSVLRAAWSQLKNTRFKHDITLKDIGKTYWYQTTTLAFGSFHGIGCHFCECDSPSNYCKCDILASFNPVFKKIEPLLIYISILPIGKCVTRCSYQLSHTVQIYSW